MRDFITFSQVLNSVVGKLTDVASATGSVLARLKYIIDTSIANLQASVNTLSSKLIVTTLSSFKIGSATSASASYTTAHTYLGSGILRKISQGATIVTTSAGSYTSSLKITLDGTVIFDGVASNATAGASANYYSTSTSMDIISSDIAFSSSLLIEHKTSGAACQCFTTWNYTT